MFNCVCVLSLALPNIIHTRMARYSLSVLKVPLNTTQPTLCAVATSVCLVIAAQRGRISCVTKAAELELIQPIRSVYNKPSTD